MANVTRDSHADDASIGLAAQRLIEGRLVAFPTETVYGLGADAENPSAIAKIYAAKQRPTGHPLIVHLAPDADLSYWMGPVSAHARALTDAFWPGPLTLIVPRAAHIPAAVSGGQPTIGLRCPSHPVAQALLTRFTALKANGQGGVAAPSANKFGSVSPTQAAHVRREFPELDESELMVLDGGPSTVGIESTIVDISRQDLAPAILRPGHILSGEIAAVLGIEPGAAHDDAPRVSGSLKAHYAPRTPLVLTQAAELESTIRALLRRPDQRLALLAFSEPTEFLANVDVYQCDTDAQAYARKLYSTLRALDLKDYTTLVIEHPPTTPEWQAVNDRLSRAAAAFS